MRAAAYLLAAVLAVSTFAGCGGIESGGEAEGTADSGNEKEAGEQNNAMGRYVEKDVELGGKSLTDWNSRLFRQEDGSFLLADNSGFVFALDGQRRKLGQGGYGMACTDEGGK